MIELLIQIVHRVSVNAERKVVTEIIGGLEQVHGKNLLLFRLAEAAVEQPHGVVSEVIFPVVDEQTLQALAREYHAKGPTYQRRVHTVLRSSYSHHYRQMLPLLLTTLAFRSDNVAHQPVTQALAWLQAHRHSRQQFVSCDAVPTCGVVRPQMQEILIEETSSGAQRINRINYEMGSTKKSGAIGDLCGQREAEPWCPGLKMSEVEQPNLSHASPELPPLFGAPFIGCGLRAALRNAWKTASRGADFGKGR